MQQKKISLAKKAQEEMVGFVLIMLLVAVIFMVFLGIYIRQGKTVQRDQNTEISQFLDSALDFTTECTLDNWHYLDVAELIAKVDNAGCVPCSSLSKTTCDVLKSTLGNLIEASWNFGQDSPNKGYILKIEQATGGNSLIPASLGGVVAGCSSKTGAERAVFSSSGTLTISLKICLD